MCIIALMKPGKRLRAVDIGRMDGMNKDGIGIAYVDPATSKVVIKKGYTDVGDFIKLYDQLMTDKVNEKAAHMVHFRFATVGGKDQTNCHPFEIKGGAMAHNGTFFGRGEYMGGKSDSRIVAERMYNNFAYKLMRENFEEYEKALGYSRVSFLYDNGEYFITNQTKNGAGWEDGIWYSNAGYRAGSGGRSGGEGDESSMMGARSGWSRSGNYYGNGGHRSFGGRD